ncbi:hypothetical protein Tery_2555 [Trichodesmium erythraeum IMS101]|uniref:PLD phosphodiesterase domain-containing protein n=1 Tax=Trichodesmium erythraeum (strain IMS101) TaxID=203124 RepID=Q111R8_TRIEI|nr:hypothetical protein [Trichodesmium erythraeum GBRTRLIN201]MCH2048790.1 hypothetical protein [Trichodesmium sp. ALOHA_ZT_67]
MFLQSSTKYISPELNNLADKIEKDSPGISVFAARQFCYKLYQTPVQIEIIKERDLNILEEFILRASIEFNPPPTEVELAQILKLDPIFIQNTTNTLQSLQTLTITPSDSRISITSEGKEFYTKGSLPQPPENKIIYAITNPLSEEINWQLSGLNSKSPELPNLADFITFENTTPEIANFTIEELKKEIIDSNLGIYLPESGKIIRDIFVNTDGEKSIWKAISILVIFDIIEEKLILQAREGNKILERVSNQLQEMIERGEILLNELCGLPPESIASQTESILDLKNQKVEERLQKIRQQGIEIIKQTREQGKKKLPKKSEFILLRDREIRPEFLSTLKAATQQILIYSPWVTEEVVDEEFIQLLQKLANNGVWILMGYGIAEKQEKETQAMSPKVEEKLLTIRTPEDLPAAQIFWLGNSHAKEVLVDRKVHLSGSHNWLSYRGDRGFRGETAYRVTNLDTVGSAYEYLQARFQFHAKNLWESAVSSRDINLAVQSVCIWGALGMAEMAFQELQYHNWIELFPMWLKVVIQGLRSKQILLDEQIFKQAISWLNIVDTSYQNIQDLRSGWQGVIGEIARQNSQAALNLLNEVAWAEFIRLEISLTDTPEKFIKTLN